MKFIRIIVTIITSATLLCAAEEPQELSKLRESYQAALKRVTSPLQEKYISELQRLKNRYNKDGNADAVLLVDSELKNILSPSGEDASEPQKDKNGSGDDFKQLEGVWQTADSGSDSLNIFEFKSPRTVFYTSSYRSVSGIVTNKVEWEADKQRDKIVLEVKNERRSSSPGYKNWYEIKIPFNLDSLEIIRFSESPGSQSSQTFIVQRKKNDFP